MITKISKYGTIKQDNGMTRIGLSPTRPSFYPSHEELIEDVEIEIDGGVLCLKANIISFFWNLEEMNYEDLKKEDKYVLYDEYIVHRTPKFLKFLKIPDTYNKHFVEEKKRTPIKLTVNAFEIMEA